jgi:hypothetical protein
MAAKYILGSLAVVFALAAIRRMLKDGGRLHPQTRTWLLIAAIFAAVSTWLFLTQPN